jgi:hypothetical protein
MLIKPDTENIGQLYLDGLSTRQVAKETGYSKSYIYKLCKDITRDQSKAAILRQPATSKHWRSTRQQARKIWTRFIGNIPKGHHIHHKDGDHTNNSLENLQCISPADHMKYHHAGPEYNIPRHLRPARKAYMKKYLKEYNAS